MRGLLAKAVDMRSRLRGFLGLTGGDRALPERVQRAIDAQQDNAELLISLVQLIIVVTFGALYTLAPKTFDAEQTFAPVPWALGAYLVFTLIRLYGSWRGRLPAWFLMLSVLLDMSLLMLVIWSFHLQYEQPPSFYLKAPTLLYVFIFIALRALRFEARYVAIAGATAVVGWAMMVLYAVDHQPPGEMVTRDYVHYMTANAILLGAEFDKIISIVTVTYLLMFAIMRARVLLIRAITEGTAARDLARFFDKSVAEQIRGSEHEVTAGQGQVREAAVLFVDIRGFTVLGNQIPPDELMGVLGEYQQRLVPLIQRNGGTIDKFMGDGIMATFGAAVPTATYAADALRAIDALIADVDAWSTERATVNRPPVRVGMAAAAGRLVFGAVGEAERLEYTVIGEPVNLTARLEKHTKEETVRALTTSATYRLAVEQGYARQDEPEVRPGRALHGFDKAVDLAVLG